MYHNVKAVYNTEIRYITKIISIVVWIRSEQ